MRADPALLAVPRSSSPTPNPHALPCTTQLALNMPKETCGVTWGLFGPDLLLPPSHLQQWDWDSPAEECLLWDNLRSFKGFSNNHLFHFSFHYSLHEFTSCKDSNSSIEKRQIITFPLNPRTQQHGTVLFPPHTWLSFQRHLRAL